MDVNGQSLKTPTPTDNQPTRFLEMRFKLQGNTLFVKKACRYACISLAITGEYLKLIFKSYFTFLLNQESNKEIKKNQCLDYILGRVMINQINRVLKV